jgi:hypothetical protein
MAATVSLIKGDVLTIDVSDAAIYLTTKIVGGSVYLISQPVTFSSS